MNKEIQEKIDKGGLYVRTVVELMGGPKEHIDKTIKEIVEKTKNIPNLVLVKSKIFETKQLPNKLFSAFTEMEIVFKNLDQLMDFCYSFYPSSVEIIEPEKIIMTSQDLSNWLNELQGKIHKIDKVAKDHNIYKTHMNKTLNTLIRNNILTHLNRGELEEDELAKNVGIDLKSLSPYLKILEKKGQIKLEKGKYKLAKQLKFK